MTAPNDNTPVSIIQDAYFEAGLLQEGESAGSEKLVSGMRRLRDLINQYQVDGLKLWLNDDITVPLVAGQRTYTLSLTGDVVMAKPTQSLAMYYEDVNGVRRPLTSLGRSDYNLLSQQTQTGAINSYYVNKQQNSLIIALWLVPDAVAATGHCIVTVRKQVTNPILLTETVNFPIEWRIALVWGLADLFATGQPQAIMDRCEKRAALYKAKLEDQDVEDASTFFAAEVRTGGMFR